MYLLYWCAEHSFTFSKADWSFIFFQQILQGSRLSFKNKGNNSIRSQIKKTKLTANAVISPTLEVYQVVEATLTSIISPFSKENSQEENKKRENTLTQTSVLLMRSAGGRLSASVSGGVEAWRLSRWRSDLQVQRCCTCCFILFILFFFISIVGEPA